MSNWNDIEPIELPEDDGENTRLVIHSLLLHDGLTIEQLSIRLPPDSAALTEILLFLRETGFLEHQDEIWRVTALGYPRVRSSLQNNEYLIDRF